MEQMFEWFTDEADTFDGKAGWANTTKSNNELRKRFQTNGPVTSGQPWNFADLPFPFALGTPAFVHQPSCHFLRDVIGFLLDLADGGLCTDACSRRKQPNRCCDRHYLTIAEYAEIQQAWRFWQGTVMMCEAGGVTQCHYDKWGFGTHISCLEGEMGFGWLPRPTQADIENISDAAPDSQVAIQGPPAW